MKWWEARELDTISRLGIAFLKRLTNQVLNNFYQQRNYETAVVQHLFAIPKNGICLICQLDLEYSLSNEKVNFFSSKLRSIRNV